MPKRSRSFVLGSLLFGLWFFSAAAPDRVSAQQPIVPTNQPPPAFIGAMPNQTINSIETQPSSPVPAWPGENEVTRFVTKLIGVIFVLLLVTLVAIRVSQGKRRSRLGRKKKRIRDPELPRNFN